MFESPSEKFSLDALLIPICTFFDTCLELIRTLWCTVFFNHIWLAGWLEILETYLEPPAPGTCARLQVWRDHVPQTNMNIRMYIYMYINICKYIYICMYIYTHDIFINYCYRLYYRGFTGRTQILKAGFNLFLVSLYLWQRIWDN